MKATLTELRRKTSKVIRPVINSGEKVALAQHGIVCAEIVPVKKYDGKKQRFFAVFSGMDDGWLVRPSIQKGQNWLSSAPAAAYEKLGAT